jgi:hypothetical protein
VIGEVPARCTTCLAVTSAEVTRKGPVLLRHKAPDGTHCPGKVGEPPGELAKREAAALEREALLAGPTVKPAWKHETPPIKGPKRKR